MVAVVPKLRHAVSVDKPALPNASQALSLAAAIIGVPSGIPVAVAASAVICPNFCPGATSLGICSMRQLNRRHLKLLGFIHFCAL